MKKTIIQIVALLISLALSAYGSAFVWNMVDILRQH